MHSDERLEQRRKNYNKFETNLVEARENYRLTLRKQKLEDYFMSKRLSDLKLKNSQKNNLEINPDNLNISDEIKNKEFKNLDDWLNLIKALINDEKNIDCVKFAVYLIRKQMSLERNEPSQEMINNKIPELLISTLEKYSHDDSISYEILWSLVNLSASHSQQIRNLILTPKAIKIWELIFESKPVKLKEEVLWIFSNITADSLEYRNFVMDLNLYKDTLNRINESELSQTSVTVVENSLTLIANIHKFKEYKEPNLVVTQLATQIACKYFFADCYELKIASLWALGYISLSSQESILWTIFNSGVCQDILLNPFFLDKKHLSPCLKILGNIVSGPDFFNKELCKLNLLDFIKAATLSDSPILRREGYWVLSNVLAGERSELNLVLNSDILEIIFAGVKDTYREVIYEVIMCFQNITSGFDISGALKVIESGIFDSINYVLNTIGDSVIVMGVLESLELILIQGQLLKNENSVNPFSDFFIASGGADILEKCQNHHNTIIANKTVSIMKKYFELD